MCSPNGKLIISYGDVFFCKNQSSFSFIRSKFLTGGTETMFISGILHVHDLAIRCFIRVFSVLNENSVWMLFIDVLDETSFTGIDFVSSFVSDQFSSIVKKREIVNQFRKKPAKLKFPQNENMD